MRQSVKQGRRARRRRRPVGIPASSSGTWSCGACKALPRDLGDPLFIGEREVLMDVRQREPRDVDRLGIRVALDAELTAGGLEQIVMDDLVDSGVRGGEPVVDGAQWGQHASDDAGLLGYF